jgi:hypothetical protein
MHAFSVFLNLKLWQIFCKDNIYILAEPGPLPTQQSAVSLPPSVHPHLRHGGDSSQQRQLHQGGAAQRRLRDQQTGLATTIFINGFKEETRPFS